MYWRAPLSGHRLILFSRENAIFILGQFVLESHIPTYQKFKAVDRDQRNRYFLCSQKFTLIVSGNYSRQLTFYCTLVNWFVGACQLEAKSVIRTYFYRIKSLSGLAVFWDAKIVCKYAYGLTHPRSAIYGPHGSICCTANEYQWVVVRAIIYIKQFAAISLHMYAHFGVCTWTFLFDI